VRSRASTRRLVTSPAWRQSPASCQARSIRCQAAVSPHAARSPKRSVWKSHRRCARSRLATRSRACCRDEDMMAEPLLRVKNLVKNFVITGGLFSRAERVHAVNGVSFELGAGETLGLVGESGCGKSTTGRCILRLIEPTSGEVWFKGVNVTALKKANPRVLRREMQIVFQDPYASLNPRMTVGAIIGESLIIHGLAKSRREVEDRIVGLLETVGLGADHMRRYPHEFSGGQRQRIGIARAPPVSA